jgi:16S rRNA C967 or C1407 C5-methylase (RsmB/RsmF family)
MQPTPLNTFFAVFCETQNHLDSLLSEVEKGLKSKVADRMGAFLRRPWTLSRHYGIQLAGSPEEFWGSSFIQLKKNPKVHELLGRLWKEKGTLPTQGGMEDFPPSMTQSWILDWGPVLAESMARLLSQDPATTLRLNRRFEADLGGFPAHRPGYYSPRAIVFKGYAAVMGTEAFQRGEYEIQDEGSQVMSGFVLQDALWASALQATPTQNRVRFNVQEVREALLNSKPMTVVDACAGSGGKALAIADFLKGLGRIFAYDIYPKKVAALKKRAERAQERNIQAICLRSDSDLSGFYNSADRLLLDVPCSGWGVLRRNPDIRWSRRPRAEQQSFQHQEIHELQRSIVTRYLPLLKPGGVMTYGVCTFQRAETLDQVEWILKTFPSLRLRHQGFIGPHETDGFFMASFERIS